MSEKQRLLIEYLISSPDTYAICRSIIKSEYFSPEFRKTVQFLHNYYDTYNAVATTDQVFAETQCTLTKREVTKPEIKYCTTEIEKFCQSSAIQLAILAAPELIQKGLMGDVERSIKDAVAVCITKELGIEYFDSPIVRLDRMATTQARVPTLWNDFDNEISGGLARGELIMFSANSGVGKSVTLANLALNLLCQPKYPGSSENLSVLYLSLELSEDMIAQRFDTMLTSIPMVAANANRERIAESLEDLSQLMGNLTIKRLPTGAKSIDIRSYLKEFEVTNGYVPDVLLLDYLDLMSPNEHVSADNISERDKRSTEQLREILIDYDMIGGTASQQNRSAVSATEMNHSHIAGGLTKINGVDWYVSIIMTPLMKASGEINFSLQKTRSSGGVGKTVHLEWDNNSLRIKNKSRPSWEPTVTRPIQSASPSPVKTLEDMFITT